MPTDENEKSHMSDVKNSLTIGKFTINKPYIWDAENVELEINDYSYESTKISISDLKVLRDYIDKILK